MPGPRPRAPLRLARSARRFDSSPAWLNWVGTAPALALLEAVGIPAIHAHDVALADRLREGLGLPPGDTAIVTAEAANVERLEAAGIIAPVRAGRLRTSWHAYNTEADVDRVLDVLGG